MAFGVSFISLDADKVEPIAVILIAGVAGYFLYRYLQTNGGGSSAQTDPNASFDGTTSAASTNAYLQQLEEVSVINALSGGNMTYGSPALNSSLGITGGAKSATQGGSTSGVGGSNSSTGSGA